jgi:ribonuclease Z
MGIRIAGGREWFLIDAGEGTQHQIIRSPLSLVQCAAIMISHAHGDHCYGIPGILGSMAMAGRDQPLTIWAPNEVLDWIRATVKLTALHLPFELKLLSTTDHTVIDWNESLSFSARELSHRVPTHAFEIAWDQSARKLDAAALDRFGIPRGPAWGQLQHGQDVRIGDTTVKPDQVSLIEHKHLRGIFGGDNATPEILSPYVDGLDVLVHEATYDDAALTKLGSKYAHSSVGQVARFAQESGIPNLVLTHFSARHADEMDSLREEASRNYTGTCFLANDGDEYQLKPGQPLRLSGSFA